MRQALILLPSMALLAACGGPQRPEASTEPQVIVNVNDADTPYVWTGYFTDTLPCADCPGIETTLWVRSDSTFVLQQFYLERDTLPHGHIGQWHVVAVPEGPKAGLLTIGADGDKPEFYRLTKEGLMLVDEMGQPFPSTLDHTLDKLADELGDAVPRMLISGTYTYMADAHTFQPCGTRFLWPCAGGSYVPEEEGTPVSDFDSADLERMYGEQVKQPGGPWVIEAVCTLGMGPAMEGDGADEYVYVERVVRTLERCP